MHTCIVRAWAKHVRQHTSLTHLGRDKHVRMKFFLKPCVCVCPPQNLTNKAAPVIRPLCHKVQQVHTGPEPQLPRQQCCQGSQAGSKQRCGLHGTKHAAATTMCMMVSATAVSAAGVTGNLLLSPPPLPNTHMWSHVKEVVAVAWAHKTRPPSCVHRRAAPRSAEPTPSSLCVCCCPQKSHALLTRGRDRVECCRRCTVASSCPEVTSCWSFTCRNTVLR